MRRADRLYRLLATLRRRRTATAQELAAHLEVSERTIYRDVRDLVEIGGPALPALLTHLYEIPLTTRDEAIQVNLIDQCLKAITGHRTGYKPQVVENSSTGTSDERRNSAIKQWFAWWHREGEAFLAAPPPDSEEQEQR